MKFFILISIILIGFSSIFTEENQVLKKSINFTHLGEKGEKLNREDFATFDELRIWAKFQMLEIIPDNNLYSLKDGICRMIPEQGLIFFFTFDTSIKKTIYIYLDLTAYKAHPNSSYPSKSLNIYLNDKFKSKVVFQKERLFQNPVRLTLDPAESSSGRIDVKIIPESTTFGRFWGIWDAFYSFEKADDYL